MRSFFGENDSKLSSGGHHLAELFAIFKLGREINFMSTSFKRYGRQMRAVKPARCTLALSGFAKGPYAGISAVVSLSNAAQKMNAN